MLEISLALPGAQYSLAGVRRLDMDRLLRRRYQCWPCVFWRMLSSCTGDQMTAGQRRALFDDAARYRCRHGWLEFTPGDNPIEGRLGLCVVRQTDSARLLRPSGWTVRGSAPAIAASGSTGWYHAV